MRRLRLDYTSKQLAFFASTIANVLVPRSSHGCRYQINFLDDDSWTLAPNRPAAFPACRGVAR